MSIMASLASAFAGAGEAIASGAGAVGEAMGMGAGEAAAAEGAIDLEALASQIDELDTQIRDLDVEIANIEAMEEVDVGALSDAEGMKQDLLTQKADLEAQMSKGQQSVSSANKVSAGGKASSGPNGAPIISSPGIQAGQHGQSMFSGLGVPANLLQGTLSTTVAGKPSQMDVIKQQGQAFGGFRI